MGMRIRGSYFFVGLNEFVRVGQSIGWIEKDGWNQDCVFYVFLEQKRVLFFVLLGIGILIICGIKGIDIYFKLYMYVCICLLMWLLILQGQLIILLRQFFFWVFLILRRFMDFSVFLWGCIGYSRFIFSCGEQ